MSAVDLESTLVDTLVDGNALAAPESTVIKREPDDDVADVDPRIPKKIKLEHGDDISKLDLDHLQKQYPQRLLEQITMVLNDNWGGPAQYLQVSLSSVEAVSEFASYLKVQLPAPAPALGSSATLHVWELGYEGRCTTKPHPFPNVCIQIAQEIDKDS